MQFAGEIEDLAADIGGDPLEPLDQIQVVTEWKRDQKQKQAPDAGQVHDLPPLPEFDEELAKEDLITIAIQVNGKLRGNLQLPAETDDKTLKTKAAKVDGVKKHLEGKDIVKKVLVPGRLVNFVVK